MATQAIKTIHSSALRSGFADAINLVKKTKRPLIVKQRNVPSVVLIDIDEYEDYLDSTDPDLIKSIAEARDDIKKGRVFTLKEVFGDL